MNTKAFYKMTYGIFVLTANENGRDNGCIINTAVQVANDPTRVSISVLKPNHTCDMIKATGKFNLSSVSEASDFSLFKHFGMQSGRDVNKFENYDNCRRTENGLMIVTESTNMYLSCKVVASLDLGSHMLFIGEVTDGDVLNDTVSCSYSYYQSHIKPKPAPAKKKTWVCSICGYVYEGDEVPDDFECPLCHHGKEDFVLVEAEAENASQNQASISSSRKFVCQVCGYVHEGDAPPEFCPVCKVPASMFIEQV